MMWWIMAPISITAWALLLPIKLVLRIIFGRDPPESEESKKIDLKIVECKASKPLDEILFIHGYPDSGEMWDGQVEVLSE